MDKNKILEDFNKYLESMSDNEFLEVMKETYGDKFEEKLDTPINRSDKDLQEAYNEIVNNKKDIGLENILSKIIKNQETIIDILNKNNRRPYPL